MKTSAANPVIVTGPGTAKFFEEIILEAAGSEWPKTAGVRLVENNDDNRPLGVAGKRQIVLTKNTTLLRCFREVVIKASRNKPVRATTYLQKIGL